MYFSAADRGEMMSMVYNWPAEQVFPNEITNVRIMFQCWVLILLENHDFSDS